MAKPSKLDYNVCAGSHKPSQTGGNHGSRGAHDRPQHRHSGRLNNAYGGNSNNNGAAERFCARHVQGYRQQPQQPQHRRLRIHQTANGAAAAPAVNNVTNTFKNRYPRFNLRATTPAVPRTRAEDDSPKAVLLAPRHR